MSKKKTLDEIKRIIYEKSNYEVEVISEEYVDNKTPLKIRCKCGNIFERNYSHIIGRNSFYCADCSHKEIGNRCRTSLDEVKERINSLGCEYVGGEYKNRDSKLLIKCSCGNICEKTLRMIMNGQNRCQECGRKKLIQLKTKYGESRAKEILSEYGYTMIGNYTNATTKVKCLCKRNHECDIILSQFLIHHSGCAKCAAINNSGENHHNYKGGVTKIDKIIREKLNPWKRDIRKTYKCCPLSGESGLNSVVHHLLSFASIFELSVKELNIDIALFDTINDVESSDLFNSLVKKIIEKHTLISGILISTKIHKQFHSEYGYGNNTPEQFNEFLIKHYSKTLDDILIKQLN